MWKCLGNLLKLSCMPEYWSDCLKMCLFCMIKSLSLARIVGRHIEWVNKVREKKNSPPFSPIIFWSHTHTQANCNAPDPWGGAHCNTTTQWVLISNYLASVDEMVNLRCLDFHYPLDMAHHTTSRELISGTKWILMFVFSIFYHRWIN